MNREKFRVKSPYDGIELVCTAYEPDCEPKGIIQIVHGMCEYSVRYETMMKFFAKQGYVVAAHDQRGHGETAKTIEDRGWFNDKKGLAVVDDAVEVTKELKKRYPDLPVYLFGHSMGSMVVRCYIQEHDNEIDKLIVCGTPGFNPLAGVAVAVARITGLIKGDRYRSKTLAYISTGKGNKRFEAEGAGAWLNRDRENVEAYHQDPYCNFIFTCNGFENLFRLMKNTYTKSRYKTQNPDLPIRFVSGADDPVLGNDEKWLEAHELLRDVGYGNVSGKLYHGLRHEIHNEPEKEMVFNDLLQFIEE